MLQWWWAAGVLFSVYYVDKGREMDDQLCRTHLTFEVPHLALMVSLQVKIIQNSHKAACLPQNYFLFPYIKCSCWCFSLSVIYQNDWVTYVHELKPSTLKIKSPNDARMLLLKSSVTTCLNLAKEFSTRVASAGRVLQFARGPPELPDVKRRNTWQVFLMPSELNWIQSSKCDLL